MSPANFNPYVTLGDCIIYAGDMGREMYCIRRGLVDVVGDDNITVVGTLGPGAYFGEVCVVMTLSRTNPPESHSPFIFKCCSQFIIK